MLSTTDETADVPVRRIDQDQINEFGRLNARKHDVLEELETETVRRPASCKYFARNTVP